MILLSSLLQTLFIPLNAGKVTFHPLAALIAQSSPQKDSAAVPAQLVPDWAVWLVAFVVVIALGVIAVAVYLRKHRFWALLIASLATGSCPPVGLLVVCLLYDAVGGDTAVLQSWYGPEGQGYLAATSIAGMACITVMFATYLRYERSGNPTPVSTSDAAESGTREEPLSEECEFTKRINHFVGTSFTFEQMIRRLVVDFTNSEKFPTELASSKDFFVDQFWQLLINRISAEQAIDVIAEHCDLPAWKVRRHAQAAVIGCKVFLLPESSS